MAVIQNDRDISLQASPYRLTDTAVSITSTAGAFNTLKNGGATLPATITLTANINSNSNNIFTAASVKTWHYALSTSPTTWVLLGAGNTYAITAASVLAIIGTAGSISYRCTVTENLINTAFDYYTVSYTKEASEPIVVDITRTAVVIPCNASGAPISYANTDTDISVSRGGTALTYNNAGGANTFKVSIQADDVARTVGSVSNTSTVYTLSGITNITVDVASVVFIVTVYDASGTIISPTIGKKITYSKVNSGAVGGVGADGNAYYLEISSPVISKTSSGAAASGTHTQITATGKRVVGTGLPGVFGFITITANGNTETTTATPNTLTTSIGNSDGKTSYTVRLYNQATVSGAVLLDTEVIPVVFTGSAAISCVLTNSSTSIPTNSAGSAGVYTGTGTSIYVYEGSTALTYDGVGTAAGTWTVSAVVSNITAGTFTDSGTYATVGVASNITADTASVTYNVSGKTLAGVSFTTSSIQTFSRAKAGVDGAAGSTGTKSIVISAYKWGTSVGTYAQAATYTWGTGIDTYPAGWSASTSVGTSGQSLYQINLLITALATDNTTSVNWSSATTNTVGYRSDGTIGPQGNSYRIAYIVNTSATPPASPTALTGDVAPTGWSFTATSTLTAGQFMYQVDGILVSGGNITWGTPYLSNLKVGSLSALSADLGTVAISSTGSLYSTGKTYGGATAGFYQGYSGGAYKFDIGNSTNYLRWDGSSIVATGISIRNTAGTEILSSGTVPADINNSNVIDAIVNNSGGLLPNWSLNLADSVNKPAGIMAVEGITDRSGLSFGDATDTWISIGHATDISVSYGFPAIPIDDSIKYVITIRHKSNSATPPATGLYLYFMEKASALVSGKTHIGANPTTGDAAVCDVLTSTTYLLSNSTYPNNSGWVDVTYTYTPTVGTRYASFCMANWGQATAVQYHVDSVSIHQDASLLGTTALWTSVTSRPTNLSGLNSTEGTKLAGIATGATANQSDTVTNNAIADRLSASGADVLTGPISLSAASAILVGTTSDGLYLGNTGIVGKKAGATTFSVDAAGNATFAGALSAATGSFAGSLSAATGSFAGSLSAATGSFAGSLSAATGTFSGTLTADAINAVNTLNIAGEAIVANRFASSAGNISVYLNGETTALTTPSVNPSTGACMLVISSWHSPGTSSNDGGQSENVIDSTIRVRRNGTLLYTLATQAASVQFSLLDVPGAVSTVYTLTIQSSSDYRVAMLIKPSFAVIGCKR